MRVSDGQCAGTISSLCSVCVRKSDLHEFVGQMNELGVSVNVLRGGHGDQLDRMSVAKCFVAPTAHACTKLNNAPCTALADI